MRSEAWYPHAPEQPPSQLAIWQPRGRPLRWDIGHQPDVPATAAAALEAAPLLRERDDG